MQFRRQQNHLCVGVRAILQDEILRHLGIDGRHAPGPRFGNQGYGIALDELSPPTNQRSPRVIELQFKFGGIRNEQLQQLEARNGYSLFVFAGAEHRRIAIGIAIDRFAGIDETSIHAVGDDKRIENDFLLELGAIGQLLPDRKKIDERLQLVEVELPLRGVDRFRFIASWSLFPERDAKK